MKYYLIAGEASGDLHAAPLMEAIRVNDPEAEFRCFGGDLMEAAGGTIVKHYREMAYMGIIPVLLNLDKVLHNIKLCKQDIVAYQPDVLILVDYPGFNLKIAKYVKQQLPHTPVYYYISPKIWAWKEYRIKQIKRYVDKLFSILPFEVPFYQKHNYAIDYVGNPTVDELAIRPCKGETFDTFVERNSLSRKPIIALLAGSRRNEIDTNLPHMLAAVERFMPHYQVVLAGAPGIEVSYYNTHLQERDIPILFGDTYALLQQSRAALVTSGTATLETALLRVPQVVCFRSIGSRLAYSFIMGCVLKIKFVSLVNLIANREVVAELLMHQCTAQNIATHLAPLLDEDSPERIAMLAGYDEVAQKLGGVGAPQEAARRMVAYLRAQ